MSIFAGVHLGGRLGTDEEAGCPGPELVDVVHGGHVSSAPAAAHLCPHNLCSQCCQGDSGPLSLSVHTASPAQPAQPSPAQPSQRDNPEIIFHIHAAHGSLSHNQCALVQLISNRQNQKLKVSTIMS